MRNIWLVGGVLTLAAVVVVVVSDLFDLELESTILLGVAVGAIVALVPDRSPLMRLAGFLGGFAVAWVGYLVEAGFLPDSLAGKAVSVALVLALCVVIAGATGGRVPLWSTLLGAAAMVGAYEYVFNAAIPETKTTSVSTATALLMTAAVGFLTVSLLTPPATAAPRERTHRDDDDSDHRSLDDMMEKSK